MAASDIGEAAGWKEDWVIGSAGIPPEVVAELLQRASIGVSLHDHSGRCVMMNDTLALVNGVDAASVVGRRLDECLPVLAHLVAPLVEQVLAAGDIARAGASPPTPADGDGWGVTCLPIRLADGTDGVAVTVVGPVGAPPSSSSDGWPTDLHDVLDRVDQGLAVCEMVLDDDGAPVDYRFLHVNQWFTEMTGLHDPVGRSVLELVPGLEHHWIERYAQVALGRQTMRFQEGTEALGRWFDVFATPVDPPGRFAIVFRDETPRRLAELALERSAERFRAMADDLPLMVWVHGPDGAQQFVNRPFCEFFGVERDEMVADRWQPLLHPDDAEAYVTEFSNAVAQRRNFRARARVRDARGAWRWLESWARPRFDDHGCFIGLIGSSADITEQVEAERALEDASTFMRRVLDSLFTFVGVLTPDGTVTEINRAPLDAAGLTFGDVIGKKFWDCSWWSYDPDVQDRLARAVERAAAGEVIRYDERIRIADDRRLWLDFQLVPLRNHDGAITHLIPSALDITERVEIERARLELHRLEEQRRARAEFLEANATRLAGALSPREVAVAVLGHLEESMGVRFAVADLVRDGESETVFGPRLAAEMTGPHGWRSGGSSARTPGATAITTNAPVRIDTSDAIEALFPEVAPTMARLGVTSVVALPLHWSDGSVVGAITVGGSDRHDGEPNRDELLREIADQTAQALQRAFLHQRVVAAHQREHAIAVRLQRALLPEQLVSDDRLRIAARYVAADAHLDVGGDWYDTYRWPEGQILLFVGDVAGHDLDAAAVMGHLRSATGSLVGALPPRPVAVLDALERVAHGPRGTGFVTAAAVVIDPATRRLDYATAGHPPPLLIGDGRTRWLGDASSPPIGTIQISSRPTGTTSFGPDDAVVLYTDGLIEHRSRSIDTGLDMLDSAARRHRGTTDPETLIDHLIAAMEPDGIRDDIVVLAACCTRHG